jgi:hypothetical protein
MNLLIEIKRKHSRAQMLKIVQYVGADSKRFDELVKVFLNGPYRVTQRAAWPISNCVELHPTLVRPHLKKLLSYLGKKDEHDGVKRNILRLLQFISIPYSLQGKTVDLCFQFLRDTKQPIAIRVFAMTVLANLAKENPELKNEIIPLIEDQMPFGSAGFLSRGKKILKQLKS